VVSLPTADARQGTRKSLIVAMGAQLLIGIMAFRDDRRTPVGVEMSPAEAGEIDNASGRGSANSAGIDDDPSGGDRTHEGFQAAL